jgi:hypothetical protein
MRERMEPVGIPSVHGGEDVKICGLVTDPVHVQGPSSESRLLFAIGSGLHCRGEKRDPVPNLLTSSAFVLIRRTNR